MACWSPKTKCWALSDVDAAQRHFDKALQYGQNNALVLSIAAAEALEEADFERAIELQRRAVVLDPLGFVNRYNMANILYRAGQFEEAGVEFLNALELNPEREDAINGSHVQILIMQHQYEEARITQSQM